MGRPNCSRSRGMREDELDDALHRAARPGRTGRVHRAGGTARRPRRDDDGAGLEVGEVELDTCHWARPARLRPLVMVDVVDAARRPPASCSPSSQSATMRCASRAHVTLRATPGRVGAAYGPQAAVVGQARPPRAATPPSTSCSASGTGRGRRGGEPEQGGGLDPGGAAAAALLRGGEPGQAELLELRPEVAVEVDDARSGPARLAR